MSKTFLHIGCGSLRKQNTTPGFNTEEWNEVRVDIDASVNPDILGTMIDLSQIESSSVDAIFSSHNIEHLYPHEVPVALAEFLRVLKPDGFFVVTCPDLKSVCALVAEDKLTDTAYVSPAGPIAPVDIIYGWRQAMMNGNLFMAHKCGFTEKVLGATLSNSGFKKVATLARPEFFDLWAIATKNDISFDELKALALKYFQ